MWFKAIVNKKNLLIWGIIGLLLFGACGQPFDLQVSERLQSAPIANIAEEAIAEVAVCETPQTRFLKDYPDIAIALGDSISIEDYDSEVVQLHLTDLNKFPPDILREIKNFGYRIRVGDKTVTDFSGFEHLKGLTPRGWEGTGLTWDDAAGCNSRSKITVILGNGIHSSSSLALHEIAHAIDHVMGITKLPEMEYFHKKAYNGLDEYFKQDGPGGEIGMKEMFAESVANIFQDQDYWSKEYEQFVKDILGVKEGGY